MHFIPEAVPAEISAHMNRLIAITGWNPWKHRLAWLQEQVRVNPTMPFFLAERFGLELAFEQIRRYHKQSGRYLWPPESPEQQRLYSFVTMATRCHHRLSQTGKTRLKGMIEDALKSDRGFASLAFEMKIAAHLMSRGFDVIFNDLEQGGGFDFLAEKYGVEMEVECKLISGDIGRQIHLKRIHQLGTNLLPGLQEIPDRQGDGRLISIQIPGRLGGESKQHQEIRNLVIKAFTDEAAVQGPDQYAVSISKFELADSPFGTLVPGEISRDDVQLFLSEKFGIENKNVLIQFHPKKWADIVVVESMKRDTVLNGIHRQLKDAAKDQFSGKRPGILCCEFAEMTEDQLRGLESAEEETGLQYMVTDLLVKRQKIHTVAFTSPGTARISEARLGNSMRKSLQETGPVYLFKNPAHALVDDVRYNIF